MILRYMLFAACLWFFAFSASAQMYQYKDENGNLCFADDLSRIPQSNYETLKIMPSVKNIPQINVSNESITTVSAQPIDSSNDDERKKVLELIKIKEKLDKTYKLLQEKREPILSEKHSNNSSPEEFNAYRNKVLEYNAEIAVYQKRQEEFEKQVKAFSAKFKQSSNEQVTINNE